MVEKRKLKELLSIYKLEPELKDIYVEGETDKKFIDWFLCKASKYYIKTKCIDLIEIPDSLILDYKLNTGSNRSKLLALCYYLAIHDISKSSIMCVIDKDFDDYLPAKNENQRLNNDLIQYTDFIMLENYLIDEKVINKYIAFSMHGLSIEAKQILKNISNPLKEIFSIRIVNEKLELCLTWIDIKDFIKLENFNVQFKRQAYIDAYLHKGNKYDDLVKSHDYCK